MRDRKEDTKGSGGSGGGVSLELEDAVDVGLFDAGPATIRESLFADYDYGGNAKPVAVWLVTYERDGEAYEQPYSLGKGWKVSADGKSLRSKTGQSGLAKNCNAVKYLLASLRAAGMPKGTFGGDPSVIEGAEVVVDRVPQEKRKGLQSGADDKERSILVIEEITSAPWDKGGKKGKGASAAPAKGKGKPTSDEDDEDEEDDEEETPKAKAKGGAAAKPVAKGRAKPQDDDEDEDEEKAGSDSDIDEEAVEALIEALDAGPLKIDEIAAAVRKATKGNPQSKVIAARCEDDDFLDMEKGWTVNTKKGTVELD